jgi:hypothetical protein
MTYLWLFAHTALMEVGHDYGDWGIEFVRRHLIGRGSNKTLSAQWEISLYPERTIRS